MKAPSRRLFASVLLASSPALAGPIGVYYVTDLGDPGSSIPSAIWAIRGNSIQQNAVANQAQEGPLALVGGEARTFGYVPGARGTGYTATGPLGLSSTGATYLNSGNEFFVDGTSDGTYNYTVSFELGTNAGWVFRFDLDWTNPLLLFYTGDVAAYGITYDATNNSLWVTSGNSGNNLYSDYDLAGNVLSSFTSTEPGVFMTALAMDLDHTLWATGNYNPGDPGNGDLYHYATDGTFLGKETPAFTLNEPLGGEIGLVPEPGTSAATLGSLALAAGAWAWRRRTARTA